MPPPQPAVAPLIGKSYPNDTNGDRIEDQLAQHIQSVAIAKVNAVSKAQMASAQAALDSMVEVELIFTPTNYSKTD
ncbi:MAG: hypothetical protein WDM76_09235 [Limisphaerales bacterium]